MAPSLAWNRDDGLQDMLVRDPIACVQEIYKHFDIELTRQTHQKMRRFIADHDIAKRKPHIYHAEAYGLDVNQLWPDLQYYRDFGIRGQARRLIR